MNVGAVFYVLGRLSILLGWLLAAPTLLAIADGGLDHDVTHAFFVTAAVSFGIGVALRFSFRFDAAEFGFGEAFATVTFSWLLFTALGALPFLLTGAIDGVLDASFEVLSGFTTTGASVLDDPALLGRPLLFWRAMTQWIGGLGIVALSVAVLPALGAGGNFLFQAEMPGPESEKLMPRISSTSKLLWSVYLGLTGAQFLALWAAGMTPFDSICHTFTTLSTGGFGTRADSVAGFGPAVQWILIAFMFVAGINFVMLFNLLRRRADVLVRNTEVRVYTGITVGVTALCALVVWQQGAPGAARGFEPLVRDAAFTTTTLITSTGFVSTDYSLWPPLLHVVLMLVMLVGACAGSTGGGVKVIRLVLLFKDCMREIQRLLRPRAVVLVKVGHRPVSDNIMDHTIGYFTLYFASLIVLTLVLMVLGLTTETSFSAVLSCLSNMGPGFGDVGPVSNYGHLPETGKLLLMLAMLLGRLEFYSVIVLFLPLAWRR